MKRRPSVIVLENVAGAGRNGHDDQQEGGRVRGVGGLVLRVREEGRVTTRSVMRSVRGDGSEGERRTSIMAKGEPGIRGRSWERERQSDSREVEEEVSAGPVPPLHTHLTSFARGSEQMQVRERGRTGQPITPRSRECRRQSPRRNVEDHLPARNGWSSPPQAVPTPSPASASAP